jgi:citrate synthase
MSTEPIRTLGHGFDWRASELEFPVTTEVGPGLAGVIASTTRVMWLDPSSGRLAYRGIPVEDLVAEPDFEAGAFLLITGVAPDHDSGELAGFRAALRASRALPPEVIRLVGTFGSEVHPTRVLRAGVSALGCHELADDDGLDGDRHWRELRIVGQVVALVSQILRQRRGREVIDAPGTASLAEGTLAALLDRRPTGHEIRLLDLVWLLYAAHGLDAPTFTSMIVASCLADPYYNVVAGLSALRGPRQGGAAETVVDALTEIGHPDWAAGWVRRRLERGEPVPGFGHPDYRMPDPRVVVLRKAAASLAADRGRGELFEAARAFEVEATAALAPKGVHVNINLYGALIFHLLGAAPAEIPCLIAAARVAGMVALVRESLDHIRLFRPLSRYVGHPERSLSSGCGS